MAAAAAPAPGAYAFLPKELSFSDVSAKRTASASTERSNSTETSPLSTPSSSAKLSGRSAKFSRAIAHDSDFEFPSGWVCFFRRRTSTVSQTSDEPASVGSLLPPSPERPTDGRPPLVRPLARPVVSKTAATKPAKPPRPQQTPLKKATPRKPMKLLASTQNDFRRLVVKKRFVTVESGERFRVSPTAMNGDCGFAAIARGINHARERAREAAEQLGPASRIWSRMKRRDVDGTRVQSRDIRLALLRELKRSRETLLSDMRKEVGEVITGDHFDALEREVGQQGISGHWLGTQLGVLEHVLIARAMGVNINIYQFDVSNQKVRRMENAVVDNPQFEINLLFSGPAFTGHFDALLPLRDESAGAKGK